MVEVKDGKKILTTPISAEDLKGIKIGDIIYLNGSMTTCRDVAHRRLVEEGRELPVDVRNNAIFHAGPIIRPLENDKFEMVSVCCHNIHNELCYSFVSFTWHKNHCFSWKGASATSHVCVNFTFV